MSRNKYENDAWDEDINFVAVIPDRKVDLSNPLRYGRSEDRQVNLQ